MSKITSVERQKKNPKRLSLFLDGKFAFGADQDLLVNFRLVVGKEVDEELLNKLLFESEVGKLMDRMYGLFSIRQRSEKEVKDYLKRLSFKRKIKDQDEISDFVVDSLVGRLKQKSLIDDLQFARSWVEARRKSKQKGRKALKMELLQKGISRGVIEELLNIDEGDEEQLAQIALEKKVRIWNNLPSLEFKKKAYNFLLRKGFEYTIIKNVVEKQLRLMYNENH